MTAAKAKSDLHHYLRLAREALLWKLDGLSEYDVRRPLTPTGTNLLGLVKHLAGIELDYFGDVFGRPYPQRLPWMGEDAEPNADMWATPEESRAELIASYRAAQAHADETIDALDLDSTAVAAPPWWPAERREVTLHLVLVHLVAETNRHGGQADIVRELLDGAVGHRPGTDNMAPGDREWWQRHHAR
ncbi:DinB family protein, partial [Saccharothrix algeriensis]